jgi:hypothetical protein
MTDKADRLVQLVKGKILLQDAPTRRDLILELYGFDIDDDMNKREQTDVPGECPAWERYVAIRNFAKLMRSVRHTEEKKTRDLYNLHHHHNDCQFYLVQDSNTKIWHCVHIIHEINGHYLLKRNKAIEKGAETMKKTIEAVERSGNMSEELRQQMRAHEIKQRWKRRLTKEYCTPKYIRSCIKELKKQEKLSDDYRPNFKGIQHVFGENAGEVKHTVYEHMNWLNGQDVEPGRLDQRRMTYSNDEELVKNMTKDIIVCDYLKQDYHRPEPQEADYLGIRK